MQRCSEKRHQVDCRRTRTNKPGTQKKTIQEARREKSATAANESVPEEPEKDIEETGQLSSTPRKPQKARKLNKVDG